MKKTTMQLMEELGLHEGGVENWIPNNAWETFAELVRAEERAESQDRIDRLYALYEQACRQRDELMDQQRAQVAAMRGRIQ